MLMTEQEQEKIRLHIGMYAGYQWIDKDCRKGLVGRRRMNDRIRPLPKFSRATKTALAAFRYLAAPLLHDLNRMRMLLEIWEEQLPSAPQQELRVRIQVMEEWIVAHGGKP